MVEMRHSHLQGAWAQSHTKIARRLRVVRESRPLVSSVPPGSDMFSWHERDPEAAEAANLETTSGQLGLPLRSSFGLGLRSAIEQARAASAAAMDAAMDVFVNNEQQLSHLRRLLPRALVALEDVTGAAARSLTRQLSAVFHAATFASIAADATSVGRAAFLEQATHGASSWVRARPRSHDDNAPQYARFAAPVDVITHHQASLLLPLNALPRGCQGCGQEHGLDDPTHFASCPCGIRVNRNATQRHKRHKRSKQRHKRHKKVPAHSGRIPKSQETSPATQPQQPTPPTARPTVPTHTNGPPSGPQAPQGPRTSQLDPVESDV